MRITWSCWLEQNLHSSMSIICVKVCEQLVNLGYDVTINAFNKKDLDITKFDPIIQDCLNKTPDVTSVNITFAYPDTIPITRNFKVNICYSGFDTDGGYQSPGNPLTPTQLVNQYADYFLTPSQYSANIAKHLKIETPIEIFPHGVDPKIFIPKLRTKSDPFTFVYTGELTTRKGIFSLLDAFLELYRNNKNYRLLLRANRDMLYLQDEYNRIKELISTTNNIEIYYQNMGQEDIINFMNMGNVYLYPSYADWAGLGPLESVASGMCVVASANNGYYEFLREKCLFVKTNDEPIGDRHIYMKGNFHVPDHEDFMNKIKFSVENYDELSIKAYTDGKIIQEEFSWEAVTKKYLVPFLEKVEEEHFKSKSDIKFKIPEIVKILTSKSNENKL